MKDDMSVPLQEGRFFFALHIYGLYMLVSDFHNDILTTSGDINTLSGETAACVCALFRGNRSFAELRRIAENFKSAKLQNLYLGLEDIGYFTEERAEEIFSWRPVYASLTWNGENALAGGCMSEGRLTAKGKYLVGRLSGHCIYIDCAHLNRASFVDLLKCEPYGLVDSHTCLNGVFRHPRNLEDWQAKEIAACGGLIGIALVGNFLREEGDATAEDVFRHIDYGVSKFGIQAICLGTDFNGTDNLPKEIRSYVGLDCLIERCCRAGYSDAAIKKIFTNNLQNFLNNRLLSVKYSM